MSLNFLMYCVHQALYERAFPPIYYYGFPVLFVPNIIHLCPYPRPHAIFVYVVPVSTVTLAIGRVPATFPISHSRFHRESNSPISHSASSFNTVPGDTSSLQLVNTDNLASAMIIIEQWLGIRTLSSILICLYYKLIITRICITGR